MRAFLRGVFPESANGARPRRTNSTTASSGWSIAIRVRSATPSTRRSSSSRSEEHTSELQSLMRISYAVFCLKKTYTTKPSRYELYLKFSTHPPLEWTCTRHNTHTHFITQLHS